MAVSLPLPDFIIAIEDWVKEKSYNDRPELWGPVRTCASRFIQSEFVEFFITSVIIFNMVIMVLETDQTADGDHAKAWVALTNVIFLIIYSLEICCRLFVWRTQFFLDGWSILDFSVVTLDLSFVVLEVVIGDMPKISVLRMFRLVKLARAVRALNVFPELRLLLKSFVGAFRAIFWGMLLITVVLLIWSILAVQILHPVNRDVTASGYYDETGCVRCPNAFRTVFSSFLTIWQTIVAGDSWGTVAVPIIEENPPTLLFFALILITVALAIMNLILAVICDRAAAVREEDAAQHVESEKKEFENASQLFRDLCEEMDADKSGNLNKDELIRGFDTSKEFADTMHTLGFNKNKADCIIAAFDKDGSGDINYNEFADSMMEAKAQNIQTMIMFVKLTVLEVKISMARLIKNVEIARENSRRDAGEPKDGLFTGAKEEKAPSGTPYVEKHRVSVDDKSEREMLDMLRTMTKKIDHLDQDMRGVAHQLQDNVPKTLKATPSAANERPTSDLHMAI